MVSEPRKVEIDLTKDFRFGNSDSLLVSPCGSPGLLKVNQLTKSEETKVDEGWAKYEVISVLGEGSYGKVFKVNPKKNCLPNN